MYNIGDIVVNTGNWGFGIGKIVDIDYEHYYPYIIKWHEKTEPRFHNSDHSDYGLTLRDDLMRLATVEERSEYGYLNKEELFKKKLKEYQQ